jgi:ABC-type transport system substrate-binding protein
MGRDENYWLRRIGKARVSRRGFGGGVAGAGVGAAALGLVGCGDDDDDTPPATTAATGTAATSTATAATATATATAAAALPKGGTFRATSANNTWDTFDVHRSRFTPVAVLYGYTNLGLVQWESYTDARMEGAFAEQWEQPDKNTIIFKLREGLRWHDKRPVNGRLATAQDIAYHITRNKESKLLDGTADTNFYRAAQWALVDKVETTDEKTVRVTFSSPDTFFLNTNAASYAKVLAPEAVEAFEGTFSQLNGDHVIGTGGFVLTQFSAEGNSRWARHEKFYTQVNLDGIQWFPLFTDQAAQQAAFEQKQLDYFVPSNPDVATDILKRFEGKVQSNKAFAANPQAGTYAAGSPPWSDPRLIGAIFKALDRRAYLNTIFKGQGALTGNIIQGQAAFRLSERELITFEGYREDYAKEVTEARQMWAAGGGPALGEIIVDIPDIWEGVYSGGAAFLTTMLKNALGNEFTAKVETYTTISTKVTKAEYGNGNKNIWYGWISDIQDPEPTATLYRLYNSGQPQWKQFQVKSDKIDALTKQAFEEFDQAKRREMCKEVERELLRNWGAGIPHTMNSISNILTWNYVKIPEFPSFVNAHNTAKQVYFDQKDPTWQGRPA